MLNIIIPFAGYAYSLKMMLRFSKCFVQIKHNSITNSVAIFVYVLGEEGAKSYKYV